MCDRDIPVSNVFSIAATNPGYVPPPPPATTPEITKTPRLQRPQLPNPLNPPIPRQFYRPTAPVNDFPDIQKHQTGINDDKAGQTPGNTRRESIGTTDLDDDHNGMDVDEQNQPKSSSPFNLHVNDDFGSPQPHKVKIPRIDEDIDETDKYALNKIFFDKSMKPSAKMDKILEILEIPFSNQPLLVPISNLHRKNICRKVDAAHVTSIISRLDDIGHNKELILNKSFFVAYELRESDEASGDGDYHYGIVVGNTRHAAAEKYYDSRTSSSTIPKIRVDYILAAKPTKSEAIIISGVAGLEAKKDKLQYSATDIFRNARLILKYQHGIFSAETLNDPNLSPENWKTRYETIVKDQLSEILNVDLTRILSSIWRLTFIDDRDFNQMLPFLVKHCTSIKKLARVCNVYRIRKAQTLRLCTDPEIMDGDYSDFETRLNTIAGRDWQFTLKEKNAYDDNKNDETIMEEIMGNAYEELPIQQRSDYLDAFVVTKAASEVSRTNRYPDIAAKIEFLKKKFAEWYATNPNIYETSKEGEPKKNLKKGSKAAAKKQRKNDDDPDEEEEEEEAEDEEEPQTDGQPKVARITKKKTGGNKRKKKKIQFKSIDITTITTNYLTLLRSQSHIAALFCHFIKTQSSNLNAFPENNVISTTAARMETGTGNFDWAAFYAAVRNNRDDANT